MFKFIFDLVTEPLGLPIEWYYEWIILGVIGHIAYLIAYDMVGSLYHGDFISGKAVGSFFHWIIRTCCFVVIWAITYGAIRIVKFVISHKFEVSIGLGFVIVITIVVKLAIWSNRRSKVKVEQLEKGDIKDFWDDTNTV